MAAAAGLEVGDCLIKINGQPLQDLIDYRYAIAEPVVELEFLRGAGLQQVRIDKDSDEDLGLDFASAVFDRIRPCANRCEFCFVHQMPPGLRDSLYLQDDDYRLSFLQGNFITLTNLKEQDWQRIAALRLSPLYISIHTTNRDLRSAMLRQPLAARLPEQLDRLCALQIAFHAQIVLIPERNDGPELDRTVTELVQRWRERLLSICVVPFGATHFRESSDLAELRLPTPQWCRQVIRQLKCQQRRYQREYGDPLIQLADEFYITAGLPFPGVSHYRGFPNLADGIGCARLFLHQWQRLARKLPASVHDLHKVTILTGRAAVQLLRPVVQRLNQIANFQVRLLPLPSRYWGEHITVTGLLVGSDIEAGLRQESISGLVWLPDVCLRAGSQLFLDNRTVAEIAKSTDTDIRVLAADAMGIFTAATK
ncbi:MAG: DUF512 domain-containing protein [Cyanobacteria bacterium NC_groundwater_1444_Ag_S-0.65um_54_12]|nr:DUF512 domain-containing protein [Cyanobacteria bacterium NC_groundwater_1444_Ag_S-0.65um_54_12]